MAEVAKRALDERFGLALVIPLAVLLPLVVLTLIPNFGVLFRLYKIPSAAMEPNYPIGSYILANRAAYGFSAFSYDWFTLPIHGRWPDKLPERGDTIVFKLPRDTKQDYVKRVVGLPGDKIQFREDRLYLNGAVLTQQEEGFVEMSALTGLGKSKVPVFRETLPDGKSFTSARISGNSAYLANTTEFDVPPRNLFVLGDNRDNSADSRLPALLNGVGFVPVENVVGKVIFTFGGGQKRMEE